MNKISCDVCKDLIPLVKDCIASEESKKLVKEHIETCKSSNDFYNGEIPKEINVQSVYKKFMRKMQILILMVLMFGIFFGISLTATSNMFNNTYIMPIIGVLGYIIFKWKAVYDVPILILIIHIITNVINFIRNSYYLDIHSLIFFTIIYCGLALLGVVIAGLLHFALRREK